MIANSKTSAARSYSTDDLEKLARELFNGSLPKLSGDNWKRRSQLAREFAAAHLTIPGISKPEAAKLAKLAPPFKAIAASRQGRVDSFLAGIAPQPTVGSVRQQLVSVLGEQALQLRLFNFRHSIAAAMILLDRLDGKADTQLDLRHADAVKFAARLDAAIPGARQKFYPGGNAMHSLAGLALLADLAAALADSQAGATAAATPARTAPAPAAAEPKPTRATRESLAAAIRSEPDAHIRAALYQHFTSIAEKT